MRCSATHILSIALVFLSVVLFSSSSEAFQGNAPDVMTFREAKAFLKQSVHQPGEREAYCGCLITTQGKKWLADWQSCGYVPRKNAERASRIEWEHVVPASEFGQQRQCWQQGGRKNCSATDPVFVAMEGDPHNLVPVVGEVNGDRGNLKYGMLARDQGIRYGQCPSRVDFKASVFMPNPQFRGNAARTYFYFSQRYGLTLSKQRQQLFAAWSQADPVDAKECERNRRIAKKTGVSNPFVAQACEASSAALRVGTR